jgi:hypothetical protein
MTVADAPDPHDVVTLLERLMSEVAEASVCAEHANVAAFVWIGEGGLAMLAEELERQRKFGNADLAQAAYALGMVPSSSWAKAPVGRSRSACRRADGAGAVLWRSVARLPNTSSDHELKARGHRCGGLAASWPYGQLTSTNIWNTKIASPSS